VSVCKIDVEGHEDQVFDGMKNSISGGLIDAFVFERHDVTNPRSDKVLFTLSDAGFKLFRIEKGLRRLPSDFCTERTEDSGLCCRIAVFRTSLERPIQP
jgi:hypothetical protein